MVEAKQKLLIVDDDSGLRSQLRWSLDAYEVAEAEDFDSAISELGRVEPPVVILDLGLPPDPANSTQGFRTLQQILQLAPRTKVIVVTGNDEHETAVHAVGIGAYDFFLKPVDTDLLGLVVARAFRLHGLETENQRLQEANSQVTAFQNILGSSPEIDAVFRTIEKVAATRASILLLGESGTGKELIARALHQLSERTEQRFVAINCAAIPGELLESELFGYEKGAFTGAAETTIGKIEHANGGTLFLDEIGDLPLGLQAKLLRFLQERIIERLGGREEIPVDVRILCATHQDVAKLITEGAFREDLYYRIGEVSVTIPPLRDRPGDAALLARSFLSRYAAEQGKTLQGFTTDAIARIETNEWKGNIRELENVVKRAVIMAEGRQITSDDLGFSPADDDEEVSPLNLRKAREHATRNAITRALAAHGGNVSLAAKDLGVSRPTLYGLMNKNGIAR